MKKNKDIDILQNLLKNNSMETPVDPEVQKYIYHRKKARYIRLVKHLGLYSFFSMIFIAIYYAIKKIALYISWKVIAVVVVSNVAVGGYLYHTRIRSSSPSVPTPAETQSVMPTQAAQPVPTAMKPAVPAITYRMTFQGITSSSIDPETVSKIQDGLSTALVRRNNLIYTNSASRLNYTTDYQMTGNLIKTDDTFTLYIKIIDTKKMSVVYLGKQQFKSTDDLEKTCTSITNDIFGKISL